MRLDTTDMESRDSVRESISRRRALGCMLATGVTLSPYRSSAQNFEAKVIYAKAYGVVADGITNDAPSLNDAFSAMSNASVLILPPGTIALGSPGWRGIDLHGRTNIRIQGAATELKWLAMPTQTGGPFGPTGLLLHECEGACISSIHINGNGVDCIGLGLVSCVRCVVSDVEAYGHGAKAGAGLGQFASCKGSGNSWISCIARDSTPGSRFRGFYLGNANGGWGESDLKLQGCWAKNNDATGFAVTAERMNCVDCVAENNKGAGFTSSTSNGTASTDHLFMGNLSHGNAFHGWQTDVWGSNADRIVLTGNNFSHNAHSGVFCHKGTNITVSANIMIGNGGETGAGAVALSISKNVVVSDNIIHGDATHGICISANSAKNTVSDLIIANNRCVGAASKTVWLEAVDETCSLQRIMMTGNIIDGGSHGVFMATSARGAVIDDVVFSANIVAGASEANFCISDYTHGQSTNVRLSGNSGDRAVFDPRVILAADAANSWNEAQGRGIAAPAVGAWRRGSIIYNASPTVGSPIGWVCTASGSPGTWHKFGLIV